MDIEGRKSYKTVLMLTLTASICVMAFQVSFSAVLDQLKLANGISSFLATVLVSSPSFFIILLSSISGRFLDRNNPVLVSLYAFIFVFSLSFVGLFAHGFYTILILRLLAGVAFAPLLVIAFKLPQMVYPKEIQNRMMTIQTLGAPIGAIIMLFSGAWLGTNFGYTFVYIPCILFSIIGIVLSVVVNKEFDVDTSKPKTYSASKLKPITNSMATAWMLFSGSTAVFLYLGTVIGKSHGIPLYLSVFGSAFLMIPPLFISPVVGEIMDKKVSRFWLMILSSIIISISLLLMSINGIIWIIAAITLGIFASIIPPIVFSTPSKFESRQNSGYAVGKINMFGTIGMLLAPPVAGFVYDISSSWTYVMIFAAIVSLAIILVAIFNRRSLLI